VLEIHRILDRRDSLKSVGDILREYSQVTSGAEAVKGCPDEAKPADELGAFRKQLEEKQSPSPKKE
jgi:hypothetical protein